jgi:hypothetical protein
MEKANQVETNFDRKDKKDHRERKEKKKNKYLRILENGLKEQMIFLFNKGFSHVGENLRCLLENDKDKDKALLAVVERNKVKIEKKLKILEQFEKGERKDYSSDEKEQRRKEKKDKKEQRLLEKGERKGSGKKEYLDKEKLQTEVQPDLKTLILDGNNMLFADDDIRKLALKGKRREAEKLLVHLALEYAKAANIDELTVIYDVTKLSFDWSKLSSSDELVKEGIVNETNKHIKLRVSSANPHFTNSDDALVAMAGELSKDELTRKLFITSDRELMKRLDDVGSQVMKTGVWFKIARAKLGEQYDSILTK